MDCDFQAHPWFDGIEWDKLYQMKAAFIPEVNDELDTQNFEKFEEVQDFPHFADIVVLFSGEFFYPFLSILMLFFLMIQTDNRVPTTARSGPWRKVCIPTIIYVHYKIVKLIFQKLDATPKLHIWMIAFILVAKLIK